MCASAHDLESAAPPYSLSPAPHGRIGAWALFYPGYSLNWQFDREAGHVRRALLPVVPQECLTARNSVMSLSFWAVRENVQSSWPSQHEDGGDMYFVN